MKMNHTFTINLLICDKYANKMVSKEFNPSVSHPLYFIRKLLHNKIKEHSKAIYGKTLDFGCGAKPYKNLFTNVTEYIGLDYVGEGHNHINEDIDFYYDGKTLPFENETFDCIFSSEVFEHVFNLSEILHELSRVVKKDGTILFTCPFVWEEHEIPVDYARYTQFALNDLLQKSGFEVKTVDKSGDFITVIHQLFILYLNYHWLNRVSFFSRFLLFKKVIRQIVVPLLNYLFYTFRPLWPKVQYLYFNNIIIAQKK